MLTPALVTASGHKEFAPAGGRHVRRRKTYADAPTRRSGGLPSYRIRKKNSLTQSQQSQQSFLVPFPQIAHSTSGEGRVETTLLTLLTLCETESFAGSDITGRECLSRGFVCRDFRAFAAVPRIERAAAPSIHRRPARSWIHADLTPGQGSCPSASSTLYTATKRAALPLGAGVLLTRSARWGNG
jgi:hypothetical protein